MTHADIDRRIARLVRRCVEKIDADPRRLADTVAPSVERIGIPAVRAEWRTLLRLPWQELRMLLLEESERGDRLRQNAPFGRLLTPRERMEVFRESRPA